MPTLRTLAEKGRTSSNAGMPTPATSTAADDSLPVPVLAHNTSFSFRRKQKSTRFGGLAVHWAKFKRRVGTGTAPSSSSIVGDSAAESSYTRRMEAPLDDGEVDEVVVDRVWSEEIKSSVAHSDHGATPEKAGSSHPIGPGSSDHDSLHHEGLMNLSSRLVILRWRVWRVIVKFFSSSFADKNSEQHYAQVR